jgi:predicted ATPase
MRAVRCVSPHGGARNGLMLNGDPAPPGFSGPLNTLKRGLADRDMLIVLDNFEQVLDAAPVVADLLQSAPGLRVLVTSRVVLRVRGEQEWRVDPLGVPPPGIALEALAEYPAVRLFVDRVRDVQPGFTLTSQNAETVAWNNLPQEVLSALASSAGAAQGRILG